MVKKARRYIGAIIQIIRQARATRDALAAEARRMYPPMASRWKSAQALSLPHVEPLKR